MAYSHSTDIVLNEKSKRWVNTQSEVTSIGNVENFEDISIDYEAIKTISEENNYSVRIPNKITIETFENTDAGIDIIICKDKEDFFNQLGL